MTVYATGTYYLLIGGAYVRLAGTTPGTGSRSQDRPSSELVTLGGRRYVQTAGRAPRSWELVWAHQSADAVRWLTFAASGDAGAVYLLDTAAASANMLDDYDTRGHDTTQPTIAVDGVQMRSFGAITVFTQKIRNAVAYTLSGWTTRTAGSAIGTINVNGAGASTINAPAGTGARRWTSTFTPAADGTVVFIVTAAGFTSGLMLTEGTLTGTAWFAGQGTPCQVAVGDPQRVLQTAYTGQLPESDYSVTLREVG